MMFRYVFVIWVIICGLTVGVGANPVALRAGADHADENSAAINAAIGAGGNVGLPAGDFMLGSAIRLRSNVTLAGTGVARCHLIAAWSRASSFVYGQGVSNVDLHGVALDGASNPAVTQGIELSKSNAIHIHDLLIENLLGSEHPSSLGPHAIDCTSTVTGSTFHAITCKSIGVTRAWGGGIRLSWGSSGNLVSGCNIQNTGRGGIFCNDGSSNNVIIDNHVSGSGGAGLGIEVQNCAAELIERNVIDHWLSVDNSPMTAVRDNTIGTADGTIKLCGIEVVDSTDIIVTGNNVTGGAKVGVSISGPKPKQRMLFARNIIEGATTWGMQIEGDAGGASELFFESNRLIKTRTGPSPLYAKQGHAVRLNGNCQSITFDQNEIAHNAGVGIQITGDAVSNLLFNRNSILDNAAGTIDSDAVSNVGWMNNHAVPSAPSLERANNRAKIVSAVIHLTGSSRVGTPISCTTDGSDEFAPMHWLWNFGDGVGVTDATPNHIFKKAATYLISVVVWDADGHPAYGEISVAIDS